MIEVEGASGDTLALAFKFVYLNCLEDQDQLAAGDQLLALIRVADYLQIKSLTRACKILVNERLKQQDKTKQVLNYMNSFFSFLSSFFWLSYVKN